MSADARTVWEETLNMLSSILNPYDLHVVSTLSPAALLNGALMLAVPDEFTYNHLHGQLKNVLSETITKAAGYPVSAAFFITPGGQETEKPIEFSSSAAPSTSSPGSANSLSASSPISAPAPQSPSLANVPYCDEKSDLVPELEEDTTEIEKLATQGRTDPALGSSRPPMPGESHLNTKYTFNTFIVGASTRFAHAACTAVAEQPAKTYNPLFIYGGSGLGKTHLLHAVGHYTRNLYPEKRVLYVNSEGFTNDFINAVTEGHAHDFQEKYRNVDVLMIDDIQFLQGKEQTMEEFFHTFNALHNEEKQIIITSDVHPNQLEGFEARLKSRFVSGLLTDVQPPDLETRVAILRNKLRNDWEEQQNKAGSETIGMDPSTIDTNVLEYIASKFDSNIRELEGALLRVTAFSSLTKQPINLQMAENVLKDIISDSNDIEITTPLIQAQTAAHFNMTIDDLCSNSRGRSISEARQIAMYLCRELTNLSLPQIGAQFGGRDHSTVLHAYRKIKDGMSTNSDTYHNVTKLTEKIRQAASGSNLSNI